MRVSNSEVQVFKRCRREWWLTHFEHLAPVSFKEGRSPLWLGSLVHIGMETFENARMAGKNHLEAGTLALQAVELASKPPLEPAGQPARLTDPKDLKMALTMLEGYFDWLLEEGADSTYETIGVEGRLSMTLPNGVEYIGKYDALIRDLITGFLRVVDTKTVGSLKNPTFKLQTDEQILGYVALMRDRIEKEGLREHLDGAMYNMLRKVLRTSTANPPFYDRHDIHFNKAEIATFLARLVEVTNEMMRLDQRLRECDTIAERAIVAYPTPTDDCSWRCNFFSVCPMFNDGSRVEDALAEQYAEFDPYARYDEDDEEETQT